MLNEARVLMTGVTLGRRAAGLSVENCSLDKVTILRPTINKGLFLLLEKEIKKKKSMA